MSKREAVPRGGGRPFTPSTTLSAPPRQQQPRVREAVPQGGRAFTPSTTFTTTTTPSQQKTRAREAVPQGGRVFAPSTILSLVPQRSRPFVPPQKHTQAPPLSTSRAQPTGLFTGVRLDSSVPVDLWDSLASLTQQHQIILGLEAEQPVASLETVSLVESTPQEFRTGRLILLAANAQGIQPARDIGELVLRKRAVIEKVRKTAIDLLRDGTDLGTHLLQFDVRASLGARLTIQFAPESSHIAALHNTAATGFHTVMANNRRFVWTEAGSEMDLLMEEGGSTTLPFMREIVKMGGYMTEFSSGGSRPESGPALETMLANLPYWMQLIRQGQETVEMIVLYHVRNIMIYYPMRNMASVYVMQYVDALAKSTTRMRNDILKLDSVDITFQRMRLPEGNDADLAIQRSYFTTNTNIYALFKNTFYTCLNALGMIRLEPGNVKIALETAKELIQVVIDMTPSFFRQQILQKSGEREISIVPDAIEGFFKMFSFAFGLGHLQSYSWLATHATMSPEITITDAPEIDSLRQATHTGTPVENILELPGTPSYNAYIIRTFEMYGTEALRKTIQSIFSSANTLDVFAHFLTHMIPSGMEDLTPDNLNRFFDDNEGPKSFTARTLSQTEAEIKRRYVSIFELVSKSMNTAYRTLDTRVQSPAYDMPLFEVLRDHMGIDDFLHAKNIGSGTNLLVHFLHWSMALENPRDELENALTDQKAYKFLFQHIRARIQILSTALNIDVLRHPAFVLYDYSNPVFAFWTVVNGILHDSAWKKRSTLGEQSAWDTLGVSYMGTEVEYEDLKIPAELRGFFTEHIGESAALDQILASPTPIASSANAVRAPYERALAKTKDWDETSSSSGEDEQGATLTECASAQVVDDSDSFEFDFSPAASPLTGLSEAECSELDDSEAEMPASSRRAQTPLIHQKQPASEEFDDWEDWD